MARPNFTNKFNPYLLPFSRSIVDKPFTGIAYRGIFLECLEKVSFKGLNISKIVYPRDAFATCIKDQFHLPPVWECECGFYSFKDLVDAQEYTVFHKGALVAEIELYGEIIEHDIGYRSREISIKEIYIPKVCSYKQCSSNTISIKIGVKDYGWRCEKHSLHGSTKLKDLKFDYIIQ